MSLISRDQSLPQSIGERAARTSLARRVSLRLPWNDHPFELIEPERDQEADDRDDEQSDIHLLDGERAPRAPDEIAQPAFRPHHLGDCNQHEPDADAQLEARHDHRERTGQRDGPERVPAVRLEVTPDVEIDLVDLENARGGVDYKGKE